MAWAPRPETRRIIELAGEIVDAALEQGYRFTLRRVFYKLVAANAIPNTDRSYRRLSDILNEARWKGLLRPDALVDLERVPEEAPSWEDRDRFLDDVIRQYRTDWWEDADPVVEVWAEKRAVSGILAPLARRYGVPFLAMRGFGSFTAVYEASLRFGGRRGVALYVGDFDPAGVEMDEDLQGRLDRIGVDVELERVALTRAQIDECELLPQPTKLSDSRAAKWPHEASWELDALDEAFLVDLVEAAIRSYLPADFTSRRQEDARMRASMVERMKTRAAPGATTTDAPGRNGSQRARPSQGEADA